jgi:hypothetical protein
MQRQQIISVLFLMTTAVYFNACRYSEEYPFDKGLVCLPYTISNEKTVKTIVLTSFGRIVNEVNSEVVFHVLPDKLMNPYISLEGNNDIIKRIECSVSYNNLYNQNELQIRYSKCVIKNKDRRIKINIYGHELFHVRLRHGSFVSSDTIQSNVGYLSIFDDGGVHVDIVCHVPVLNLFLTNPSDYIINGIVDSCSFNFFSAFGAKSPTLPSNLRNLKYKSLRLESNGSPDWDDDPKVKIKVFVGRPQKISYLIIRPYFECYYQGKPEITSLDSPYNPMIWEP